MKTEKNRSKRRKNTGFLYNNDRECWTILSDEKMTCSSRNAVQHKDTDNTMETNMTPIFVD